MKIWIAFAFLMAFFQMPSLIRTILGLDGGGPLSNIAGMKSFESLKDIARTLKGAKSNVDGKELGMAQLAGANSAANDATQVSPSIEGTFGTVGLGPKSPELESKKENSLLSAGGKNPNSMGLDKSNQEKEAGVASKMKENLAKGALVGSMAGLGGATTAMFGMDAKSGVNWGTSTMNDMLETGSHSGDGAQTVNEGAQSAAALSQLEGVNQEVMTTADESIENGEQTAAAINAGKQDLSMNPNVEKLGNQMVSGKEALKTGDGATNQAQVQAIAGVLRPGISTGPSSETTTATTPPLTSLADQAKGLQGTNLPNSTGQMAPVSANLDGAGAIGGNGNADTSSFESATINVPHDSKENTIQATDNKVVSLDMHQNGDQRVNIERGANVQYETRGEQMASNPVHITETLAAEGGSGPVPMGPTDTMGPAKWDSSASPTPTMPSVPPMDIATGGGTNEMHMNTSNVTHMGSSVGNETSEQARVVEHQEQVVQYSQPGVGSQIEVSHEVHTTSRFEETGSGVTTGAPSYTGGQTFVPLHMQGASNVQSSQVETIHETGGVAPINQGSIPQEAPKIVQRIIEEHQQGSVYPSAEGASASVHEEIIRVTNVHHETPSTPGQSGSLGGTTINHINHLSSEERENEIVHPSPPKFNIQE